MLDCRVFYCFLYWSRFFLEYVDFVFFFFFFFQAEDGIRDLIVTWSSDVCSSDLFYIVDSVRTSYRFEYDDPRLLGSRLALTLAYSVGDRLHRYQADLEQPFRSTLSRDRKSVV